MRLLFLGDVVGRSGRAIVAERLPRLRKDWKLDFVVANGENAAGGFGITEAIYQELLDAGCDVITLGNHSWDQREALVFIERAPHLIRPLNYPPGTPGRGSVIAPAKNGTRVLVVNLMGRIFMDPLDDPFAAIEQELAAFPLQQGCDAIVVDLHAEATSDMTDVGMCGDYESVIGMVKDEPMRRFLTRIPSTRFEAATGPAMLSALAVEIDEKTGLASRVAPVRLGAVLSEARPTFWE
jgi:calcineurin-like phosphoesterase